MRVSLNPLNSAAAYFAVITQFFSSPGGDSGLKYTSTDPSALPSKPFVWLLTLGKR